MKKIIRRVLISILVLSLLTSSASILAAGATTAFKGHWAAETLNRALDDALITGKLGDIHPDDAITGAEVVTMLCRVLAADSGADLSGVTDIKATDPYYTAASQAVALGMISVQNGRLNLSLPVTRGRAYTMLANAFQLVGAYTDTSGLAQYSDSDTLYGDARMAAAALTAGGFVKGGCSLLRSGDNISLAEFLTILYRIIPNYKQAGDPGVSPGGVVISGNGSLAGKKYEGNVYFDGTVSDISLQSVDVPCAVVRSASLSTLSVNSSTIGRLVIAAAKGSVDFGPDDLSAVGTVVVGGGGGGVTLRGTLPNVEITGDGRNVTLSASVHNLVISGRNCTVTLSPGFTADSVKILGQGTGNRLLIDGNCGKCEIYGANTTVGGAGSVQSLTDNTRGSAVTVNVTTATANSGYGLNAASLALSAPNDLPSYQSLNAKVTITAPDSGVSCKGFWYINDVLASSSTVTLGKAASASLTYAAKNTGPVPVTVTLSFVLYFDDPAGGYQVLSTQKDIVLENPGKFDLTDVKTLVTTGYKGDYTLKWAKAHDYDEELKTAWVNLSGYSSKTGYLVWVNITYQRVNVFSGSSGSWKLEKTFLVGTGAPGKDTPVGVFKIIGRSTKGWTTKDYTVKPVIFFNTSAYGFHSRLYAPGTTKVIDSRIGFPISHGCIRMYDEDVDWFYKTIPTGTTVVVY